MKQQVELKMTADGHVFSETWEVEIQPAGFRVLAECPLCAQACSAYTEQGSINLLIGHLNEVHHRSRNH